MSKTDFINLLFLFRERLRTEEARPGWNVWAIIGTVASLTWILLERIESSEFEIKNPSLISISLICLLNIFGVITTLVGKRYSEHEKITYSRLEDQINGGKPLILSVFLFQIFLICFLNSTLFSFSGADIIILNTHFGISFIITLLGLIVMFVNLPIPDNQRSNTSKISTSITGAILLVTSILAMLILLLNLNEINVGDIKNSLLVIALGFLIQKYIRILGENNTFLNQLDGIIEDVTFNRITVEKGLEQFEIISFGSESQEYIKPYLQKYLDGHRRLNAEITLVDSRIQELIDSNITEPEIVIQNQILGQFRYMDDLDQEIKGALTKIQNLYYYFLQNESDMTRWNEAFELMRHVSIENSQRLLAIKNKLDQLVERDE